MSRHPKATACWALGLAVWLLGVGAAGADTVVLLHGLGRTSWSMRGLEGALQEAGYRTVNLDYPSRHQTLAALADGVAAQLEACCADARRLHFVTHSMGGIVVRVWRTRHPEPRLGRVVMLAPPNNGSEIIDLMGEQELFAAVMGPAATELSTAPDGAPRRLPPVDFELGVITGDRSTNPFSSWLIPGPDDGKVSTESARVEGMADFLVVDAGHTFVMDDPVVRAAVLDFLRAGAFRRRPPGEEPGVEGRLR